MRIGIITFWSSNDNYGQLLQCYALQKYLRQQEHDVFLIKYNPISFDSKRPKEILKNILRPIVYSVLHFFNPKKFKPYTFYINEKKLNRQNKILNRGRKFDEFRDRYIVSTPIEYTSIKQLRNYPPIADIYMCGSDQIWNTVRGNDSKGYFLDFGKKNVKRIAYSCSIGGKVFNIKEQGLFCNYIKKLDAISVRESSLKHICDSAGRTDAEVIADPTFLLPKESYIELAYTAYKEKYKPYMFLYILNVFSENEIDWSRIEAYIHDKNIGLSLVNGSGACQARPISSTQPVFYATIPEWLNGIKNAECVLTSSFHGVVFSIIMQKPFLAILLTNEFAKGNDRITSLLSELGLSDRIFSSDIPLREQMEKTIDWNTVNVRVQNLSSKAESFLRRHIS